MAGNAQTVSPDWLQERLEQPGLSILDGSWYLPAQGRDARAEYDQAHIPGALFFDQDVVVEPEVALPHAMPRPSTFQQFASSMGITADETIIVYDGPGFYSAPRVWWLFRVMGAERVCLLDGGLDRWRMEGRPVSAEPTPTAGAVFHPRFDKDRVVGLEEMRRIVARGESQIVDARAPGRFRGHDPEPRDGIRPGHMPGAYNVPASALSDNGRLLAPDRLRHVFEAAGVDLGRPIVTSCGSGVTAAALVFALHSLGHDQARLYDGSWSEWGALADTPVVTGDD